MIRHVDTDTTGKRERPSGGFMMAEESEVTQACIHCMYAGLVLRATASSGNVLEKNQLPHVRSSGISS